MATVVLRSGSCSGAALATWNFFYDGDGNRVRQETLAKHDWVVIPLPNERQAGRRSLPNEEAESETHAERGLVKWVLNLNIICNIVYTKPGPVPPNNYNKASTKIPARGGRQEENLFPSDCHADLVERLLDFGFCKPFGFTRRKKMNKRLWLCLSIFALLGTGMVVRLPAPGNSPARSKPFRANLDSLAVSDPLGWEQSNANGFGTASNNMISALEVFDDQMYATTGNDSGSQVWRTSDGKAWSEFTPPSPFTTTFIYDAKSFGTHLYIGTYLDAGGEIWRTDGTTWERVATGGLGDANNLTFSTFAVYSGDLYVATGNLTTGVEIWRSSSGDSGSWTQVNEDGFGGGACWDEVVMDTFGGYLYVGFGRAVSETGSIAELWRTDDGTTWHSVFTDGLGNPNNTHLPAMAEYNGNFYIGLRNIATGGQIWSTENGTSFTSITTNGFNTLSNNRPYGLYVFRNALYLVFSNYASGAQVWQTNGSGFWAPIMQGGWGDGNTKNADYFDKAAVAFNNALYIGNGNDVTGGQIWKMLNLIYLPLVTK